MKRMLPAIAVAMVAAATVAATASASHNGKLQGRDFAVGAGWVGTTHFSVSAHQTEPLSASGQLKYRTPSQRIHGRVLCINVIGPNRAFVLAEITRFAGDPPLAAHIAFELLDGNGAQPDAFAAFFASALFGCGQQPFPGDPLTRGNIVVHDGSPA